MRKQRFPQSLATSSRHFAVALACLLPAPGFAQDIKLSPLAVSSFMRQVACPSTSLTTGLCPGYVVAAVRSICSGGSNSAGNLHWKKVDASAPKEPVC